MPKLENRIPPPIAFGIVAALMGLAAHAASPPTADAQLAATMAALVAIIGAAFALPAFRAFAQAQTTINPINIEQASSLVTGGVFRISRNPMYVSLTLLLLAWAIYLRVLWLLPAPLLFALFLQRFQIQPEERVMREKFGSAYTAYCAKVRRWL